MAVWRSPWQLRCAAVLWAMLGLTAAASPAQAQPPASNPNQMCGTGEEFTVELDGTTLGIDDTGGLFRSIDVPTVADDDEITLPKGCRIYAFLISGFGDNDGYDHIAFYKVAEFVAQNNGYVHVGWWNNLTAPYMERPLHAETISIQKFLFGIPLGDPVNIFPAPKTEGIPDTFINTFLDLPKANPDDDYQFLSDARTVFKAVREHNPDALIIVVGHSMGANGVARVGAMSDVPIDLLALIDPVGNRDTPRDDSDSVKFNWTRWRATHDFKGWKQRDCIRVNEPGGTGLCKPFFSGFSVSFKCTTRGEWLPDPPLIASRAPVLCPGSHEDPGPRVTIGSNVRYLHHRWQTEFLWPVDFESTERFNRPAGFPLSTTNILSTNYQKAVLENVNVVTPDPNGTCAFGIDPRDSNYLCNPTEGHGEIIGVRTTGLGARVRPGLALTNWPPRSLISFTPGQRRDRLIELAVDGDNWPYRPINPDLCLVCDGIITVTEHLMSLQPEEEDTTPPTSEADSSTDASAQGWFNEDVVVSVSATDAGSGVDAIQIVLSGAQTGSTSTAGSSAAATVTAEGLTTVSYFARDVAGNDEPPHTLDIRIDKTAPTVAALTDVAPNAHEWNGSPVVVSFPATDEPGGSGLASSSADVPVNSEGAGQLIEGGAEDNADNAALASVTLNIDLTPPGIALDNRAPSANAAGWNSSPVTVTWNCSDALSGVLALSDAATVAGEGAGQSALGTCRDKADHVMTDTVADINIDLTPPGIALDSRVPAANAAGWNNSDVTLTWNCSDALSGPLANQVAQSLSTDGASQTATGTCVDIAGHAASNTQAGINIDKTNPTSQITTPANGAVYLLNAIVNAAYGCEDALSGVTACAGTVDADAAVHTATVGNKTFNVSAADAAGNQSAASHEYTVQYAFSGFSNPIAAMPAMNTANAGRTVPVKYSLHDVSGTAISDLTSFVSLVSAPVACDTNVPTAAAEETDAAGSTTIHFDSGQFIYNWKTQSAWQGTCRVLQLTLKDGTRHMVTFQFK